MVGFTRACRLQHQPGRAPLHEQELEGHLEARQEGLHRRDNRSRRAGTSDRGGGIRGGSGLEPMVPGQFCSTRCLRNSRSWWNIEPHTRNWCSRCVNWDTCATPKSSTLKTYALDLLSTVFQRIRTHAGVQCLNKDCGAYGYEWSAISKSVFSSSAHIDAQSISWLMLTLISCWICVPVSLLFLPFSPVCCWKRAISDIITVSSKRRWDAFVVENKQFCLGSCLRPTCKSGLEHVREDD